MLCWKKKKFEKRNCFFILLFIMKYCVIFLIGLFFLIIKYILNYLKERYGNNLLVL